MITNTDEPIRPLLRNQVRAQIFQTISASPGVTVADIARTVGVTHQTTSYHLKFLRKGGYVVDLENGNRRLHFANGSGFNEESRTLLSIATSGASMRVLELVERAPWILRKEVALTLAYSRTAVAWHVDKLIRLGLVCEFKERGKAWLFVDRARRDCLRQLQCRPARYASETPNRTILGIER